MSPLIFLKRDRVFLGDERDGVALFERLSDPRGRQGQRHPLAATLAAIVCAKLGKGNN